MIYIAKHPTESGFVSIVHHMVGYEPIDCPTQEQADAKNESKGITPEEVQAAVMCSMFDCWENFDTIVGSTK